MPELPEVQTTVNGLQRIVGEKIIDVWSSYNSNYYKGKRTIKDIAYFRKFKKIIVGAKVISAKRRAKYILIGLSNSHTIICHMKMTGHFLVGKYEFDKRNKVWKPKNGEQSNPLNDSFNKHIRTIFRLGSGIDLAFSDTRRFGNFFIVSNSDIAEGKVSELSALGPEPLELSFSPEVLAERLAPHSNKKIKPTLMDQSVLAGIGNIYADEILWRAGIHPEETVENTLVKEKLHEIFKAMKFLLKRGIDFGGDSMSDYRNVDGERGRFQNKHEAYRRTGEKCRKANCTGRIVRKVIATRSSHFCDTHQILGSQFKK